MHPQCPDCTGFLTVDGECNSPRHGRDVLVLSLLDDDWDPDDVAREVGLSRRQVIRIRHKARGPVAKEPPKAWTPELEAQALRLLQDRAGYAEAARTIGFSVNRVSNKFPGYALSRAECMERATTIRMFGD